MKTISLREACNLLKKKKFVQIGPFQAAIQKDVEYINEPDHTFLELYWEEDGIPFEVSFTTKDNKDILVDKNGTLKLISTFGDTEEISIID